MAWKLMILTLCILLPDTSVLEAQMMYVEKYKASAPETFAPKTCSKKKPSQAGRGMRRLAAGGRRTVRLPAAARVKILAVVCLRD